MPDATRFDVVIVGAGPAGLSAALQASVGTSAVAIIDANIDIGGQIWRREPGDKLPWMARPFERVRETATILDQATVIDARRIDGRFELIVDRLGQPLRIETGTLVLATGARELFLPFPGWTLPGVVGVGALQALMKSGLDVRGKRIVVAGSGPLLLAVTATAARKGAEIVAIVEQASLGRMVRFAALAVFNPLIAFDGVRYARQVPPGTMRLSSWVSAAHGRDRVSSVTIDGENVRSRIECDFLACAYGLVPNLEVARLLGCAIGPRGIVVDGRQATSIPGVFAAGECTGIGGVYKSQAEGGIAGQWATGSQPGSRSLRLRDSELTWGLLLEKTFALRPELMELVSAQTIICRCEDVRRGDLDDCWSTRQAKLYSRAGMGACQGRICGAALARMFGWQQDTVRAPLQPAALSSLIGAS